MQKKPLTRSGLSWLTKVGSSGEGVKDSLGKEVMPPIEAAQV